MTPARHWFRIDASVGKSALYQQAIQAGLHNLIGAIIGEELTVTGKAGLASLRVALEASSQERLH